MRTQKSFQNISTRLVCTGLSLLLSLFATPLVLRWLGDQRYGAYRMLQDWFGYLSLLELGLSGGMLALLARSMGRRDGDLAELRSSLRTGLRVYVGVAAAMLAGGLAMAIACQHLVPVSAMSQRDLRVAAIVLLLQFLVVPLAPFRTLADAAQRGHKINLLLFAQGAITIGLSLLLAWLGMGITGQAVAVVTGYLLFSLTLSWGELLRHPGILREALFTRSDPATLKSLHHLNGSSLLLDTCGKMSYYADNLVVGLILGPTQVVAFVMTQRLAQIAQTQLLGVGNATWAALAELHFQDKKEVFRQRVIDLTALVSSLGVAVLVPIALLNHAFIELWVGPSHYAGDLVTALAVSNALFTSVWSLWGWCFSGTGLNDRLLGVAIQWALVNIGISVLATKFIGPAGPLIGTFASFLLVPCWQAPFLLKRTFGIRPLALWLAMLKPIALGMGYYLALYRLSLLLPAGVSAGWIGIALKASGSGAGFLLLWWVLGLGREERQLWKHRMSFAVAGVRPGFLRKSA